MIKSAMTCALLMLALALPIAARTGEGIVLVSAEEFSREQAARDAPLADGRTAGEAFDEALWTRSLDAPEIRVIRPHSQTEVESPIDIDIRFAATGGASIDVDSLHISYGLLGIDITDRIREAATVTSVGIEAKGAQLPAGKHSITVEIADDRGRTAKETFKFKVKG